MIRITLLKIIAISILLASTTACEKKDIKAKIETVAVTGVTTLIAGPVAGVVAGTVDYVAHIALESNEKIKHLETPEDLIGHVATDLGTKIIIAWILFELIKMFLMPKFIKSVQRKSIKRENRDILK